MAGKISLNGKRKGALSETYNDVSAQPSRSRRRCQRLVSASRLTSLALKKGVSEAWAKRMNSARVPGISLSEPALEPMALR